MAEQFTTSAISALSPKAAPPAPDTVLLWVTVSQELQYQQRGIFPELRRPLARAFSGASALFFVTADLAAEVLADAEAQDGFGRGPLRNVYRAMVRTTREAIAEAAARPGMLASPTATLIRADKSHEVWQGTKEQLTAHGIKVNGPWPCEPGGKRWIKVVDARGYEVRVKRLLTMWPHWPVYEAEIDLPRAPVSRTQQTQEESIKTAELAKRDLACMPNSADEFRAEVIDSLRMSLRIMLEGATKPARWHGYTLDRESLDIILEGFDAIEEAVLGAQVHLDGKRHVEIAQGYRAKIAAGDAGFQKSIADLLRPNPELLQGGAR